MIAMRVTVDWAGFEYLKRGSAINRAVRIAINRQSSPVKAGLSAAAPVFRNYLSKSMRIKVILHTKKKGSGFTAIIGPSGKYVRKKGKYKFGKKKGEPKLYRPARYAHLAERKHHYTVRTFDTYKKQFADGLNRAIQDELAKAAAKVKKQGMKDRYL